MEDRTDDAEHNVEPSKVYTFDVEYDYHYGGLQVLYEKIIGDRSWFKMDRKPFEHEFPQSLPDFLYRIVWRPPYEYKDIKSALDRGAKLKALSMLPGSNSFVDKSLLFRNLARHLRTTKQRLFKNIPITYSFHQDEVYFHRDIQRFCRVFLAIEGKTTPDKILPLRVEADEQTGDLIPIFYEFKKCKFPKGSIVEREGFENPEWDELDFEDTFFGEGANKWMIKAGLGYRGAAIEIFSNLEELDTFLSLFINGYDFCFIINTDYNPESSGSPSLIPGMKPAGQTTKKIFNTLVIQKYLEKPQLIQGHKHTVRVYALHTQENKVYMYEEYYTCLSGIKFDLNSTNYISHITGVDLSDKLPETVETASLHCMGKANIINQVEISDEQNREIVKMIFDSAIVNGVNLFNPDRVEGWFEMYGLDIIYDKNNKAWLIEFNDSPDIYGQGHAYFDDFANRLMEDNFKLTIDKIFDIPADGKRLGMRFTFGDYPDGKNLWTEVVDNSNRIK